MNQHHYWNLFNLFRLYCSATNLRKPQESSKALGLQKIHLKLYESMNISHFSFLYQRI